MCVIAVLLLRILVKNFNVLQKTTLTVIADNYALRPSKLSQLNLKPCHFINNNNTTTTNNNNWQTMVKLK